MITLPERVEELVRFLVCFEEFSGPGPFLDVDCAIDRAKQVHQGELAAVGSIRVTGTTRGHGAACAGPLFCFSEQLVP